MVAYEISMQIVLGVSIKMLLGALFRHFVFSCYCISAPYNLCIHMHYALCTVGAKRDRPTQ